MQGVMLYTDTGWRYKMKSVIYFLLPVLVLVSACTKQDNQVLSMTFVDSVNVADDITEYMKYCTTLKVYGNELFATEYSKINVFDLEDLSYKRTIGREGSAPGEFRLAADIVVFNDTLYAADYGNSRIQLFTVEGEYIKSVKSRNPYLIDVYDNKIYVSNFHRQPDFTLWKYENGQFFEHYKIGELIRQDLIKQETLDELENQFVLFNGELIFIRPNLKEKFYRLNSHNKFEYMELNDKLLERNIDVMSNSIVHDGKLCIVATYRKEHLYDKNVKYETSRQYKEAGIAEEYLFIINKDFEIEKQYLFPVNSFAYTETLVLWNNYVIVFDAHNSTIYKYKLEG